MTNKNLFRSRGVQKRTPKTNAVNNAGGKAYDLGSKAALAQFAVTGTFHDTFYVGASDQLQKVEQLAQQCDSEFIAKLAVYAREHGRMKDMPAYLLAVLASRKETDLVKQVFPRICTNSKMLLAFARIVRSGATGRSSFGTAIKKLIQDWITSLTDKGLYLSSVGHSDPSMADLIKMVHPRPHTESQSNMFSYLLGKDYGLNLLPRDIRVFEDLKRGNTTEIPDIPFRALTNCDLNKAQWRQVSTNMPWNTLRQSLVLLGRRGVFEDQTTVNRLAAKLADEEAVIACNAFPFELLATWKATQGQVPVELTNAIQEAMEIATRNVPKLPGSTLIAVDVSGSMSFGPITGRNNKPSIVSTVEGAAVIACSLLRHNKNATMIGFDTRVHDMSYLNPFDSIMTNVQNMRFPGGGTDCSLPFQYLNQARQKVDNIIVLSDYESWAGSRYWGRTGAAACSQWMNYSARNRNAKLACVDLQPQDTTQVPDQPGRVINIGGWNDPMFRVLDEFFNRDPNVNFVSLIEDNIVLESELG